MTRSDRGFTIVEVLVVAGVMAILLSLLLPALSKAKEAARQAKCLAQVRNHQQLIFAYAISYDDQVPYIWPKVREPPDGIPHPPPHGSPDWYLLIAGLWQVPLMDSFGNNGMHESLFCPSNTTPDIDDIEALTKELFGLPPEQVQGTRDYYLSEAMFFDPEALDPADPKWEPRYYVPQKLSGILFPSDKGFLRDAGTYHDPQWQRVGVAATPPFVKIAGFGDGSVALLNTVELIPGLVMNPTGNAEHDWWKGEMGKLSFTPWGVRGRDR